jgi:hypothetical protein
MGIREYRLKKAYGIDRNEYLSLLQSQGGKCPICGNSTPGGKGQTFVVDHDHKTGNIRGLLCHKCNTAIGLMKDNPHVLRGAIDYLDPKFVGKSVECDG